MKICDNSKRYEDKDLKRYKFKNLNKQNEKM